MTAGREPRARNDPNYDSACFHSQQCAGKYLKRRLQEEGIRFSKIHDLEILLDLLLPVESEWDLLRPQTKVLKVYEVDFPEFLRINRWPSKPFNFVRTFEKLFDRA